MGSTLGKGNGQGVPPPARSAAAPISAGRAPLTPAPKPTPVAPPAAGPGSSGGAGATAPPPAAADVATPANADRIQLGAGDVVPAALAGGSKAAPAIEPPRAPAIRPHHPAPADSSGAATAAAPLSGAASAPAPALVAAGSDPGPTPSAGEDRPFRAPSSGDPWHGGRGDVAGPFSGRSEPIDIPARELPRAALPLDWGELRGAGRSGPLAVPVSSRDNRLRGPRTATPRDRFERAGGAPGRSESMGRPRPRVVATDSDTNRPVTPAGSRRIKAGAFPEGAAHGAATERSLWFRPRLASVADNFAFARFHAHKSRDLASPAGKPGKPGGEAQPATAAALSREGK
jgi:hypothetical protein